ncbi:MAG: hypothetical protein HYU88_04710 [Chloroflexi bacterium]|nr:hypothetical protein [Chloroflexota bacterium]MBI4505065.1 hypothetical protein [Chloroflexota bacterium]
MIYWAQLLHFYQPPDQLHSVLEKVCDESYRPLIEVFRQHPHARATVNVNGVLTELLHDHGHHDVIDGLRELAARGQIEFVGSGKHHPILPLIPEGEMLRQVRENARTNRFYFGDVYAPQGFFPPEMCYSPAIVPPIAVAGHAWLIVSGVGCPTDWPLDVVHELEVEGERLAVFFRDDILSNKISFQDLGPQDFLNHLEHHLARDGGDTYVVTAMDAETYGHHIQQWEERFLAEVYDEIQPRKETHRGLQQMRALSRAEAALLEAPDLTHQVQSVTVSELLHLFPRGELIAPKPSSWSATAQDIEAGNPYPLWRSPDNEVHRLQWEHMTLCLELVHTAQSVADTPSARHFAGIARGLLDRALHSCQFWWASRRPMWDINLIHRGLVAQWETVVNAFKAINSGNASAKVKRDSYYKVIVARDVRDKIVDRLFLD